MSVTLITDHVNQAQGDLIFQYKNATLINAFVSSIVGPLQDIEYAIQQLNEDRSIANAVGIQLDNIGSIVGVARRGGQTDAEYLVSIYGQIGVNRSNGLAEDLIQAFITYTGAKDCVLWEFFPAQVYIQTSYVFDSDADKAIAIQYLQTVVATGIYFSGFVAVAPIINFAFDGYQVGNLGAGFGDLNNPSVGGFWSNEPDPTIPT